MIKYAIHIAVSASARRRRRCLWFSLDHGAKRSPQGGGAIPNILLSMYMFMPTVVRYAFC